MRAQRPLLFALLFASAPAFAEPTSVYTEIDVEKTCTTYARAAEGDGDWADMVCDGYRGYPVSIAYADGRESVFYGFPPEGDAVWESFDGLNATRSNVEWRLDDTGTGPAPFATIHRWGVNGGDDPDTTVEVLVVEKVGQPGERDGCAVGYVVASGNPNANERARNIADLQARDFVCGADQPVIEQEDIAVPSFRRGDN